MRLEQHDFRWKSLNITLTLAIAFLLSGCGASELESPSSAQRVGAINGAVETVSSNNESNGWHYDLDVALTESRQTNRPLLVVSVVGDLGKRC